MSTAYHQCHLERREGPATLHHTSWLPGQFAVVGGTLRLKQEDNSWSEPWVVTFVSEATLSDAEVRSAERAHLKQRKASDI
jgi:hypothetical protein